MICWNMDTPQDKVDRFLDAVIIDGWPCYGHPDTIEAVRARLIPLIPLLVDVEFRANKFVEKGTLYAIKPPPTIEEMAEEWREQILRDMREKQKEYF